MPNIDLGTPYNNYIQGLIDTGLYHNYTEVVEDALRHHMDFNSHSKKIAIIHAAIAEGEEDIKAGNVEIYNHALIDRLTAEVLRNE